MDLECNLQKIKENISNAAKKVGRSPEDITLVAVTKTVDTDIINEALKLDIEHIGENKVQEIQRKYDQIEKDVKWHMIGHLQSNKVKYIIDKVDLVHSLDRKSLAKELNKRAKKNNKIVNALIQVNVAEEESKYGLKLEETIPFIESILDYDNIKIKGLMTMAPYAEDPEDIRYVFRDLKKLSENIKNKNYENVDMNYLSMGMTNDYEIAVEEGANIVRVGTGIFGKRNY
ncbi:YggS family pyridoxal phosphate-dependent enzyme [Dethiothermospora halolimnae]|uniref:YggS family pyridoxal phosphate-dependent enzyme n=1 Tax=Dethiothermospora halolimnae TaxID=3114390 RepID=UPI003CCC0C8E